MEKLLYVDDEPDNLLTFQLSLSKWFHVDIANDGEEALGMLNKHRYKVLVTDYRMPKITGLELANKVKKLYPTISIIILTAFDDNETILEAINQGGIFRYLLKPWDINDLHQSVISAFENFELKTENINLINDLQTKNNNLNNAIEEIKLLKQDLEKENTQLKTEFIAHNSFDDIIGESDRIKSCFNEVNLVSQTDSTVLLLGESGTGKELFANAIHNRSKRKENVIVKINCAAIPTNLIESELFGHEKGAFTGADKQKFGKFELANNGTIFLDEIGELPSDTQAKLLRVLQEGEIERLGGSKAIKTNFRLITATNRDLENEVKQGKFRADLYYRINVMPITIPALRHRKEDIPLLINYFIDKNNRTLGKKITSISSSDLKKIMSYSWPGNIRELENIVERASVLSSGTKLVLGNWFASDKDIDSEFSEGVVPLEEFEKRYIIKILKQTKWKIRGNNGAAELLHIHPSTLDSKIKKLKIKRPV